MPRIIRNRGSVSHRRSMCVRGRDVERVFTVYVLSKLCTCVGLFTISVRAGVGAVVKGVQVLG